MEWGTAHQIRVPQADGTYRAYPLLMLLGITHSQLQAAEGFGMPPVRLIEQRGPEQQGSTYVDYRYDPRILQVIVSERLPCAARLRDTRWDMIDLLRPSRTIPSVGVPRPLIYRVWTPGGGYHPWY